ncbi:uncharacterized protein [Haliotis cracherodii]|uniref:uncharacterized protein n=1 Tax=Haliotis cracherodii TaxID=6455 RepID=UPI0039ED9C36
MAEESESRSVKQTLRFVTLLDGVFEASALIAPSDVNPICMTTTETLIAHPTKCAQYYNCSAPAMTIHGRPWEKNRQECPYPQLYNPGTQRCEHYSMVTCGNRTEPVWKCKYPRIRLLCDGMGCGVPCYILNYSCKNLPDGLYEKWRMTTPLYVLCIDQRPVYFGGCPGYEMAAPVFDAMLNVCRLASAMNPICLTKRLPLIPHPTECAQYYNCTTPAMKHYWEANLQECPYPQLYDPGTQRCEHYSKVQCGNRTEPLGKCEYLVGRDSGTSCFANNPSCRNLPDGLNAYEHCPNSPKYAVCVNQRLVYTGVCYNSTGTPIFDAKLRSCR